MENFIPFPAPSFVKRLSQLSREGFDNPWAGDDISGQRRRDALVKHLRISSPKYLVIEEHCRDSDAAVTGIPLVSGYSLLSGIVPSARDSRALDPSREPPIDQLSNELWRGATLLGVAERMICFAGVPLVPRVRPMNDSQAFLEFFRFARSIAEWYPQLRVICIGERCSRVAEAMGVRHMPILPPRRGGVGVVDQLVEIIGKYDNRSVGSQGAAITAVGQLAQRAPKLIQAQRSSAQA